MLANRDFNDITFTKVRFSFKINSISIFCLAETSVWECVFVFRFPQMLQSFQVDIFLPHVTARSVPKGEQVDMEEWKSNRMGGRFYAFADEFYFALVAAHWGIQINVAAFNFSLFLSPSFTPRPFNFPWSFFSEASVHPGDRCTIGALKLRNVYIIHITPQKVVIKLYTANEVGSRGLKVLPISQMSQRIDRERKEPCWGFDSRTPLI